MIQMPMSQHVSCHTVWDELPRSLPIVRDINIILLIPTLTKCFHGRQVEQSQPLQGWDGCTENDNVGIPMLFHTI